MVHRMREQQAQFMQSEFKLLPRPTQAVLQSWISARARVAQALQVLLDTNFRHPSLHASVSALSRHELRLAVRACTDMFVVGGFFDDTASFAFECLGPRLRATFKRQWSDFNILVADGLDVDGVPDGSSNKVEEADPDAEMSFLGLLPNCALSRIEMEPDKCLKYTLLGDKVVRDARKHARNKVPLELIDRLEGQLGYASTAKPALRADMQVLRMVTGTAHYARKSSHTQASTAVIVTEEASVRILDLCKRLSDTSCSSFFPRQGIVGLRNPRLWIFTDASCDFDPSSRYKYRGWGAVVFLEGSGCLCVMQQPFSWNARNTMRDSTAMEYLAATLALQWCIPIVQYYKPDVIHVLDNFATVGMVLTNKAKAHAERVLSQWRSDMLDALPDQSLVVAVHVVRERIPEIDFLTKNDMSASTTDTDYFFSALRARFSSAAARFAIVEAPCAHDILCHMMRVTERERARAKRAFSLRRGRGSGASSGSRVA